MRSLIYRCISCRTYTMGLTCPKCSSETEYAIPPRYSPNDRFQHYRIMEMVSKDGQDIDKEV